MLAEFRWAGSRWTDVIWPVILVLLLGIIIGGCIDNAFWNRALESAGLQAVWHEERTSSGCTNWIEIVKKEVAK